MGISAFFFARTGEVLVAEKPELGKYKESMNAILKPTIKNVQYLLIPIIIAIGVIRIFMVLS